MENIDVLDKLTEMINEAKDAGNDSLAKDLHYVQIGMIRDLSREWSKGFDVGNGLALKEIEMRRSKGSNRHV